MRDISNDDNILDSREVIRTLDELLSEREDLQNELEEAQSELETAQEALDNNEDLAKTQELTEATQAAQNALEAAQDALEEWDDENGDGLKCLQEFVEEAANCCSDWEDGSTLIRESYFTDYAQELVQDIGDLPRDIPSYLVIDWDATADNLRADYSEVDWDGVTYLCR